MNSDMGNKNKSNKSIFLLAVDIIERLKSAPELREVYYDPIVENMDNRDPIDIVWKIFRHGGFLCHCVNLIQKNTIMKINRLDMTRENPFDNPETRENVSNFLDACENTLFIPATQLFDLNELYHDNNISSLDQAIKTVFELIERISDEDKITLTIPKRRSKFFEVKKDFFKNENIVKNRNKRTMVINEIVNTERKYVNDMGVLQSYFQEIKNDKSKLLSDQEIADMSSNLDELVESQRRFLIEMESILYKESDKQSLGVLFNSSSIEEYFSVYSKFCSNYPVAIQILEQKRSCLKKYNATINDFDIPSYLIRPVQRICRYPMLIKNLIKSTPKDNPDIENLKKGLAIMKRVAASVNEKHREGENILAAEDLRERVEGWKDIEYNHFGSLIAYGNFNIIYDEVEREVSVYMFENFFICCKKTSCNQIIRRHKSNSLDILVCIDTMDILSVTNCSKDNIFMLKYFWKRNYDKIQSFVLKYNTVETLNLWKGKLDALIVKNRKERVDTSLHSASDLDATNKQGDDGYSWKKKHNENVAKISKFIGFSHILKGNEDEKKEAPLSKNSDDKSECDIDTFFKLLDMCIQNTFDRVFSMPTTAKITFGTDSWLMFLIKVEGSYDKYIQMFKKSVVDKMLGKPDENILKSNNMHDCLDVYYKDKEDTLIELKKSEDVKLALSDWGWNNHSIRIVVERREGMKNSGV